MLGSSGVGHDGTLRALQGQSGVGVERVGLALEPGQILRVTLLTEGKQATQHRIRRTCPDLRRTTPSFAEPRRGS